MEPKVNKTLISSGRPTNIVTFLINKMILRMVTNLCTLKNLLLNPQDHFADPPESAHYSEVNSGS